MQQKPCYCGSLNLFEVHHYTTTVRQQPPTGTWVLGQFDEAAEHWKPQVVGD